MRKPELTDRDKGLLELLARGCVLRTDQVALLYGVGRYHYDRLTALQGRELILRRGRYVEIAAKGLRVLGVPGRRLDVRQDWQREHRARVVDVYFALSGWGFQFALEFKRKAEVNANARFDAVISKNNKSYAVYLLNYEARESTLSGLKKDFAGLGRWGFSGAVVLSPSTETLNTLEAPDFLKELQLKELLALPYAQGIGIFNNIDALRRQVRFLFPGFTSCARPFADLEKGDTFVTVLITNDLIKRRLLHDYVDHVCEKEARKNVIVCLESQESRFAELIPGVEVVAVPDSVLQKTRGEQAAL
ncbi:MAG: hypothetical protein C4570_04640 [Ammonifex sp.]|nr:MAG: hypothetical protein C4570_04640 [Ammonifex sp.]